MPRKPWQPRPDEADLFYEVYIDESSQTKNQHLVLGALVVPLDKSADLERHIISARDNTIPPKRPDGTPRIIKWEKVNAYNLASYKKVVDAFFAAPAACRLPVRKRIDIYCYVVDTTKRNLKATGDGDVNIGLNKEIYFLCTVMLRQRLDKELFHIYPDRRTIKNPEQVLREAQNIMNNGLRKYGDEGKWPVRRLQFQEPQDRQALQVVDIFIGALAYRLNGHYDKPNANAGRKALCDYILKDWCKIRDPLANTGFKPRVHIFHRGTDAPTLRRRKGWKR